MFGARDVVWSLAICAALTLLVQCRPVWSARRFIERESTNGFREAYAGRRYLSGEVIVPQSGGAHLDPMAPMVLLRRLEISAERTSWTGDKAEFVVRHLIQLQGVDPAGDDASQEIHVQIEKRGGSWFYTLFEVRGRGTVADPNERNPWAVALEAADG
jgi:hypothetical protein